MTAIKSLLFKLLGALVMEKERDGSAKVSLGRVILIVVFGLAVWRWCQGVEIQQTMLTVLMSSMGYVLGSKAIDGAKDWVYSKTDSTTTLLSTMHSIKPQPRVEPETSDATPPPV
jgi:hypothetical protein